MLVTSAHDNSYAQSDNDFSGIRTNKRRRLNFTNATKATSYDVNEPELYAHSALHESLPNDEEDGPLESFQYAHGVVPPHPLGIKPLGNAWDADGVNIRLRAGSIAVLPDEALMLFLEYLDARGLRTLGSTCKALYAFCRSDDLWKTLFIESSSKSSADFTWRGTWRSTYLDLAPQAATASAIPCHGLYSDVLYRPHQCAHLSLAPYISNIPHSNAIDRLPDLSPEDYAANWSDKPFILTEPVKHWPAYKQWSIDHLLSQHGESVFRAEAVDWKFKTYVEYMRDNRDESPLYLFDSRFAEKMALSLDTHTPNSTTKNDHKDHQPAYTPPTTFSPDLFEALAPHRPDHRWLIIGPPRSGSTFHADPNGTAAWNAVLRGAKYWLMFPPPQSLSVEDDEHGRPRERGGDIPGVHLSPDLSHITSPLSLAEYLLTFHAEARRRGTSGEQRVVEAVCVAGEVLHVPAGWFHMVVNLDPDEADGDGDDKGDGDRKCGVALTQNFVSAPGLPGALVFLRDRREQVSGFEWGLDDDDNGMHDDCNGTSKKRHYSRHEANESKTEGEESYGAGQEYELFVSRLRRTHPETLRCTTEKLERRDREAETAAAEGKRVNGRVRRSRWEEVVKGAGAADGDGGETGGGEFSFGFGDFGSEDDEEDEESDHDG